MQLPLASRKGRAAGLFFVIFSTVTGFFYWAWANPDNEETPLENTNLANQAPKEESPTASAVDQSESLAPTTNRPVLPPDSPYHHRDALDSLIRGKLLSPNWAYLTNPVTVTLTSQSNRTEQQTLSINPSEHKQDFIFSNLPFDSWSIEATTPGFRSSKTLLTTSAEIPDYFITLPLEPDTVILGQVLDTAGTRVVGIPVYAQLMPSAGGKQIRPTTTTKTEEDGFFHLTGLRKGLWEISAGTPRNPIGEPLRLNLAGPEARIDIRIEMLGSTSITVLEKQTRKPIAGARIVARLIESAQNRAGHGTSATTDQTGIALLPHLPAGDYTFTVFALDHRRTVRRGRVEAGQTLELHLPLPRASSSQDGL